MGLKHTGTEAIAELYKQIEPLLLLEPISLLLTPRDFVSADVHHRTSEVMLVKRRLESISWFLDPYHNLNGSSNVVPPLDWALLSSSQSPLGMGQMGTARNSFFFFF